MPVLNAAVRFFRIELASLQIRILYVCPEFSLFEKIGFRLKTEFIFGRDGKIFAETGKGMLFFKKMKKMGKKACAFIKILFINVFFKDLRNESDN